MTKHDTRQRVPHERLALRLMHEAVSAMARVFDSAVPLGNTMHVMAQQAARVADAFLESPATTVWIGIDCKEQWMSAAHARVLRVTIPLPDRFIGVMAEETGQRVADADWSRIVTQARRAAAGAAPAMP